MYRRFFFLVVLLPLQLVLGQICPRAALAMGSFPPLQSDELPQAAGIVATVNGEPITLRQLESLSDLNDGISRLSQNPTLDFLQRQYGESLAILIVDVLVMQDLAKRGDALDDSEVLAAEKALRADFPPGAFEALLEENDVDLESWREHLRRRLSLRRFQERVLRPRFTVEAEAVQARYEEIKESLKQPEKLDIYWFQDEDAERLKALRERWQSDASSRSPDALDHAARLRISADRLPPNLRKDLQSVKIGQATPIRQEAGVHRFAVLLGKVPARQPDVSEAYALLERDVAESRMEKAYAEWLEETLARSDIRMAHSLRPSRLPDPPPPGSEMPGVVEE